MIAEQSSQEIAVAGRGPAAKMMPISLADVTANEVRVLVIEDHEATRYAYTSLMRHRGYVVTGAANATEALDATVRD